VSRRAFVAGNWKMHKTATEARAFVPAVAERVPAGIDVAVCPPFTAIPAAVEAARGGGILVFAQTMHWAYAGAYTGEVSAPMLVDAGVDGVLIGHSERRTLFGDTDADVARKLGAAHAARLRAIVAVGETEEERVAERTHEVLRRQVETAFADVAAEAAAETTVAYEPVWAIGTGRAATPALAQEAHAFVRGLFAARYGDAVADRIRLQYGGSVKPDNAAELVTQPDIDGALVGGACLEVESFAAILAEAAAVRT
jgi:triosephosphate isomerase